MIIKDKKLTIEATDVSNLIRIGVGQFMFRNKNAIPENVVVDVPSIFRFKYDMASPEQSIPVTLTVKESKDNDTTDTSKSRKKKTGTD